MAQDVHVEVLLPVENFVVYKNKIRKEMSETPVEDLEMYKKFEWERAVEWWGYSLNNIKNKKVNLDLLIQVRDLLEYSWETHPITEDECKIINKREADKRVADLVAKIQEKEAAKKAAWDALTPEEQKQKLRSQFFAKLFGWGAIFISIFCIFLLVKPDYVHPYPVSGCPTNHFWDSKEGVCKKYYNLP